MFGVITVDVEMLTAFDCEKFAFMDPLFLVGLCGWEVHLTIDDFVAISKYLGYCYYYYCYYGDMVSYDFGITK